jgi:peptidoglycan/LPS O-acetylase OafA/YrhL
MLICVLFIWLWTLPNQILGFAQSLIAVSLFAANILFWHEGGYFYDAAADKPLLYTRSLAVEEQFYALFPIFNPGLAFWKEQNLLDHRRIDSNQPNSFGVSLAK